MTDLKEEIDGNKIIVGGFKIPLTIMDRTSGQKINKEIAELNTVDQTDLTDINTSFYPREEE